ncbi:MAG: hypothetical protein JO149_02565 [Gammaproteobacteria bacterium]|nr:hypothetical protein [Gammaproteobacteria bacterium]
MDKNADNNKTPKEIPAQEEPHKNPPQPLKDPVSPSKNNPINPKIDEPTKS